MSEQLIAYLRKYIKNPEIPSLDEIDSDLAALPKSWLHILSANGQDRINRVIDTWKNFGPHLSEITSKLESNLVSVQLLKSDGEYSLLYEINGVNGPIYYEAKNPMNKTFTKSVAELWESLPQQIKDFYEWQNGWFYLASHSLGPSPSEEIFLLSDEDWVIFDEIEKPAVDLSKSIVLFTNGASGYVCIDLSKDPEHSALIWWSNKEPTLDLQFWDVVDTWTAIGMDG